VAQARTTELKGSVPLSTRVEHLADRTSNPFGQDPPCERFVPGYGDVTAAVHVVGDHPGVHGGLESGIPFTGKPWSRRFYEALRSGGLLEGWDDEREVPELRRTYLSYLHACEARDGRPSRAEYARLEPFFDAELRAITAHVLVPVGETATTHVRSEYTARDGGVAAMAETHATEVRGSGWLVVPVADPSTWDHGDGETLAATLRGILDRDFRQTADLGRFLPGDEPYLVR
jgi:uracil-DNA glycosylase